MSTETKKALPKPVLIQANKLILNDKNPRIIKDDKFYKLVKSLKEFPKMLELRPVITNKDYVVLAGNMRLRAALHLKFKQIPVIIADELSEEEQRELIVKDNVSYGDWDWDTMADEFTAEQLEEWGLDVPNFETLTEIEAKGRMAATLDEKLDTYLNATIKQIVLYYDYEEYEEILRMMGKVAEKNNLDDNSSVIKFLLDKYKY